MKFNETLLTNNAHDTWEFGQRFAKTLQQLPKGDSAKIICLYGELGSGKTTFVQGLAKGLGIDARIISPTFIIVRRYQLSENGFGFLYHLDLYRLQTDAELDELGLAEIFEDSKSYVVIEWAEKLTENFPEKRIDIWFTIDEQGSHHITMKKI